MADLKVPSLNRVILSGRLVRDPEVRFTPGGVPVANFSIAVNRRFKDRQSGEWRDDTAFLDIVAWQQLAERCRDGLHKGSAVIVEGRIQTRTWETQDGQKRKAVEINAQSIEFLDRVRREPGAEEEFTGGAGAAADDFQESGAAADDDNVPF
jgi:single-strand DNA-binding protein